jgi:hypothetical protein
MSQLDTLRKQLAEARENAAASLPATYEGAGTAVATVTSPGRPISTRELLAQGSNNMQVKTFLKVDRVAFLLGKDDTLFKEFEVEFRMSEVVAFFGLRYGSTPARYERSLDRRVNARNGKDWAQCIAEAQRLDQRCRGDYRCVDVPFTVLKDYKSDSGEVLVAAGEKIGWTSSITNFKDFEQFAKDIYDMIDAGIVGEDVLLRGKIKHEKRTGGDNAYGALTFVGFDVADKGSVGEGQAEAA